MAFVISESKIAADVDAGLSAAEDMHEDSSAAMTHPSLASTRGLERFRNQACHVPSNCLKSMVKHFTFCIACIGFASCSLSSDQRACSPPMQIELLQCIGC